MDSLLAGLVPNALVFLLIVARLSAMFAVAPFFNSRSLPMQAKAGLVVIISYASLPLVAQNAGTPPDGLLAYAMLMGKEILIGLAFGLVAQMLFAAVQMAGALIDINAGFAIANVIDPTANLNITVLGKFYNLVAMSAFLSVGGHLALVGGVIRSFDLLPPLAFPDLTAIVTGVSGHADDIILVALQIGAPILVTLFISDIALGIVSRSVPQMNVFIVGLPLKIIVALGGIAILLPTTIAFFTGLSGGLINDLSDIVKAAAP